jgi:tRNA (guanine37-N1)-methyltransferase
MFLKGDVKKVVPRIKKKFDRILMPLPKGAENFLHLIWKVSKKGTIVHFYDFEEELNIKKARKKVIEAAKKAKKKIKIKKVVKCGQYGPRKFRLCLDFNIQ